VKITTLLAISILLSATLIAQNRKHSSKEKEDVTAIRNADKHWSQAVAAKDLDKTISFYGDGASVLPFNTPLATGKNNIRDLWSHLFATPGFHLQFAPTTVDVATSGDMAYDIGTFELKMNGPQGTPTTTQGKYVVVWKKQKEGWKAVADIFNTDK
jgi:Ketosteroid isomerase homolog